MNSSIKKIVLFAISSFLLIGNVNAAAGARHYSDDAGNVFLGGKYIEVGVSKYGVFGTTAAPRDEWGFHFISGKQSQGAYLGLLADGDGWDNGENPVAGDFFTPGTPEERWMFAYKIDGNTYVYTGSRTSVSGNWITRPTATDVSNGNTLQADLIGETEHNVKIKISYIFNADDFEYETKVDVENNGEKDITDVRFLRSFDPDQDQWFNGTYETYNKVTSNPTTDVEGSPTNFAMVVARGAKTGAGVFFLSFDNRAKASLLGGLNPSSIYESNLYENAPVTSKTYTDDSDVAFDINNPSNLNGYKRVDAGIAITTNLGTITKNQKDSTSFITSLDPNVEESLNKLSKVESDVLINKIVIKEVSSDQYYALYKGDTLVAGWLKDEDNDGIIEFGGLESDTEYTVKTISKDDYDKTKNKPKENVTIEEHTVSTLIDPLKPAGDNKKQVEIIPTNSTIEIKNPNPNYTYYLVDEDGNVIDATKKTSDNIIYNNLKENKKYYLYAELEDGRLTGQIEIVTKEEIVIKKEIKQDIKHEILAKTDEVNPKTFDKIDYYIISLIVSIIGFVSLIIYKKHNKTLN